MLAPLSNTAANCCKLCVHNLRITYFKGSKTNLTPFKGQSTALALRIVLKLLQTVFTVLVDTALSYGMCSIQKLSK